MVRCFLYLLLLLLPVFAGAQKVLSIKVDGSINPASAAFIKSGIDRAAESNAQCLIIRLNTPGGLLKSTRVIVSDILESPVPVVVYVSPGGAHAGSAGVFITMAAHIAAMAPSTNIGAAHPVSSQGHMDSTMNSKATNDAAAFIRSIAEKRKRNLDWAEDAVRNSVSITEIEALDKRVVDLVSPSEKELLKQIDGRSIETVTGTAVLKTADAEVEHIEMSLFERILNMISDPNMAYILMMLGFYGIMFELYNPSTMVPGIVGVICLILAFYSMHTLPVNYAGLALIIFAIILFILELKIVSNGLLGVGAVVSLVLGSIMLIRTESALEFARISWSVIISTVLVTSAFFLGIIGLGLKAQKAKVTTGVEGLVGKIGEVIAPLEPAGMVRVHGELWSAESTSGLITKGAKVKVTAVNNLKLLVEQVDI
ncbi:NfeD family protein [Aridibaculum aurantiacum]|uniref:NfeD family protein n=1 Tax=Aridibaculum aurantiacum TaxID=2810307 RepID=UPI001A95A516|nr:nodulation protein NfeD [Aridibaculum aurantiacum]